VKAFESDGVANIGPTYREKTGATKCITTASFAGSDSTRTGTGTVLSWNNIASVPPRNIFCSGVGPCGP